MTDTENTSNEPAPDHAASILETVLDDMELTGSTKGKHLAGVSTGFRDLDTLTRGFEPGTLTVIAARPSIGRTTLLSDFCRTAAVRNGLPTLVYTLEEKKATFMERVLCAEARIPRYQMRSEAMDDDCWTRIAKRMPEVSSTPLYVRDPGRTTMLSISLQCDEAVKENGIQLIAIDGIQDIRPQQRSDLREREVGDVVRDLKTMARELNVPVVVTSHLNRGPEQRWDKKPMLDDLRESGAITFAADTIILLHREDAYDRESPRAGEADLIVAKHRNGPTATLTVAHQGHYGRFVDMAQT